MKKEKDKHPPAMHRALAWPKHGYLNQMVKFTAHLFQGIAGRPSTEGTFIFKTSPMIFN